jgi:hypothetical protein
MKRYINASNFGNDKIRIRNLLKSLIDEAEIDYFQKTHTVDSSYRVVIGHHHIWISESGKIQ